MLFITGCIILRMFLNDFSVMLLLIEKAVHIYATGQFTQLLYQAATYVAHQVVKL